MLCVVLSHSVVSDSGTSWTVAHQAPLSMRILQASILEWVAMPSSRGSSRAAEKAVIKHLTGTDVAAGRCCLSGLQVLIKKLTCKVFPKALNSNLYQEILCLGVGG